MKQREKEDGCESKNAQTRFEKSGAPVSQEEKKKKRIKLGVKTAYTNVVLGAQKFPPSSYYFGAKGKEAEGID